MSADYPSMTTAEIRSKFLNFFEERGLKLYPSSSLVPDDPSLLLANAGMNQFKEYYQGKKTMKEIGAISCQKCVRTNDIDCIGEDGRHLSFFEMLGDFSFGGVSKQQACAWAFELITKEFKLPLDRLYFTVFTEDDETHDVWRSLGVAEDHISRLGEDDNFWAAGPTGPCGPCSEIYFDMGEEVGCGSPDCKPGCDCDRFLEFWNLVFTQYDRQEDGSMPELPHRNLDTGMGLERMAAIMQHKTANYDGDLMQHLIKLGEEISGKTYDADDYSGASRSLRIIADHSRAVDFMISDGILPGNEGREYVLRRLLRRAVFHGRLLGIEGAFLTKFIDEVNAQMGEAYPELLKNVALVKGIVASEEERFSTTLDNGRVYLDEALAALADGAVLPGDVAFKLHDTFGFPIDLTVEIAGTAGHDVDMDGFTACMEDQKARARANAKGDAWGSFNDVWVELSDKVAATEFDGYDNDVIEGAKVVAIVRNGESVESAAAGEDVEVVLDRTPFYAEMGGQQGDAGKLSAEGVTLTVADTKNHNGLYAHVAHVAEGTLTVGATVTAALDAERRGFLRRNHTATHLLDAALKQVLGEHVSQAGSLVTPEHLRFDFTHFEALSSEQLKAVEDLVNQQIFASKPVVTRVMGIDEAKASGAVALFGEKYGERVRVVSTGGSEKPFSRELCGGTHARNTADLGLFKIVSEGSVGSNARRIEAVTSMGAVEFVDERLALMDEAAATLKCRPADLPERVSQMRDELREAKRNVGVAKGSASGDVVAAALRNASDLGAYRCVFAKLDGVSGKDLRSVWDFIRDGAKGEPIACVVASTTPDGKAALLAAGTESAVAAG
ncbi:MAG: alanine--tRNA ligase, partial [Collinsella sp.]|nr:alanine--tRNA ligase [Collinsella sp.]